MIASELYPLEGIQCGWSSHKHSLGESPKMPRPFSPISSNVSSKTDTKDPNTCETIQKSLTFTTPSRIIADEENKTPKAEPMQTTMTQLSQKLLKTTLRKLNTPLRKEGWDFCFQRQM